MSNLLLKIPELDEVDIKSITYWLTGHYDNLTLSIQEISFYDKEIVKRKARSHIRKICGGKLYNSVTGRTYQKLFGKF